MMDITDDDVERMTLAASAGAKNWPADDILRVYFQILIDGPNWNKPDPERTAVVVLPGQQDYRITRVLQGVWPQRGRYLWVAGTRGDPSIEREDIFGRIYLKNREPRRNNFIEIQGWADNTPSQMRWVCKMAKKYTDVNDILITTAAYHLPRCVLTLVKELSLEGAKILITPLPLAGFSGDSFARNSNQDFTREIAKILKYQQAGHVASLDEWKMYFDWMRGA